MKKILILGAASLALIACQPASNSADPETVNVTETTLATTEVNEELNQWFEDTFMEEVRRYPQYLAQLGIQERTDEWNNPSREFALETIEFQKSKLADLREKFDPETLNPSQQLSYRLFVKQAEDEIAGDKWWGYFYPFNQMFGAQSGIPTFMLNYHRIDTVEDAEHYIARLNGIDDYLGTIVDNSRASVERGIQPPKFVYAHVIRDANNILKGAPFEDTDEANLILNDFNKKIGELDISDDERADLSKRATDALMNSVGPAYQGLISEMEAQQATASTDDGVWKLPSGDDFYKYRLEQMTTTDLSASEIHDLGLAEVARIHEEMRAIMTQVGFEGTLQEFFAFLKEDPQFTYEDSDEGRQAYLDEATRMIDVMKTRLDDVFVKKPEADLEVRRVESFREKSAGKAFYNRPAQDGSRPGIYYANLYKITDMPKYQMEALAYHEGIPGHHMQLAIAQELEGVPKFQKFGSVTAYTEGWGLYSEYLPKEMGFYEDPYSDFGRLAMEIWRAARLVVDTGLHDKQWTRQQAIDYLLENTPNPENDAIKAIERYIVMPGQATAYKIGMLKILELRDNAKSELGDNFDIREFHDVVLETGPVPLNVLEERVGNWVRSKQ